ncbi:DUF2267 domain-containing protein [Streptomyces flavofungini]|uniref:DUF2267 domain-containing protein n=1 Tax=Streptomyces flavofungini TaxID=68200 RepID=UPI0034DF4F60
MSTPTPSHSYSRAYTAFLEQVRYQGAYATLEQAERVTTAVLAALGQQLVGDERVDLAHQLPAEAARSFAQSVPRPSPLSAHAFVKRLAESRNAPYATTRWDVGSVLVVLARTAERPLLDRVLNQLPSGYALLFGRADLTAAARRLETDHVAVAA